MQPQYEKVATPVGASWRYHVLRKRRFQFEWHHHEEYELTLVTAGRGRRFIGDSISAYNPGDLVLIGPDLPHAFETTLDADTEPSEAVVLQFRRDFLGAGMLSSPEFAGVARMLDQASRGLHFPDLSTERLRHQVLDMQHVTGARLTLGLLNMLTELSDIRPHRLASEDYSPQLREGANLQIDSVCRFLHDSYTEKITLEDVAAVAHMSPGAFSRFFRRTMGRTFQDYMTELRIGAACRLLSGTELPVSRIATQCGYQNIANFNRRFRQLMGTTPRTYRSYFHRRDAAPN
ncbi:AraC family transcriptional regulator [Streptomyces sp. SYSU K217416]